MKGARTRIARWIGLGFFGILVGSAVLIDAAFVQTEDAGFCPTDATWTIHTADAGLFWRSLESSDAYRTLETARPQPLRAFDREVHIRTGVRPASWRWRLWMGKSLLVAGRDGEWGASVRPGVLLRALHIVRAPFNAPTNGVFAFGDLFYAWREGFMVVSPSEAYVTAALRDEAPTARSIKASQPATAQLVLRKDPLLAVTIAAEDGIPVSGTVATDVTPMDAPLVRNAGLEAAAGMTVYARRAADMAVLWRAAQSHAPRPALVEGPAREAAALWEAWDLPSFPADWDSQTNQTDAAWLDLDLSLMPPMPGVVMYWSGGSTHPLTPWAEALGTVPYEWSGEPGMAAPLLGNALQLCLSKRNGAWIAASNEPLMARVAELERANTGELDADVAVIADYDILGEWLRTLLEEAGRLGIARGVGRDDIRANYSGWLDAASSMGRLHLEGRMDGDVLRFDGFLAQGAEVRDAQ